MKNTIVHHEGVASLKVAVNKIGLCGSVLAKGARATGAQRKKAIVQGPKNSLSRGDKRLKA